MHLPGIITMSPDNVGLIDRVGAFMGDSFLEELWTARYLDALGGEESEARKREVSRKMLREEFAVASRYECAYTLPDEAGAALGFLGSELAKTGKTWMEIEEEAHEPLAGLLSPDEARALADRAAAMEPISYFGWGAEESAEMGFGDYLYFAAWAVDPSKRGSGAFRRLTTPFFDFADERGIPCFLECYADHLESLYAHVGFETFRVLETAGFDIKQVCMVRMPRP